MKTRLLYVMIAIILSGCARLDRAGDAVLREIRSINEGGEASYEAMGGPPAERGQGVKQGE